MLKSLGILILDEVDLILNPLKSELNFPIGRKQRLSSSPERYLFPLHLFDGVLYHIFNSLSNDETHIRFSFRFPLFCLQFNVLVPKSLLC